MAVVLAIIGLLAALFLPLTNAMLDNNRRKETRTKLETLQSALTRFVITNRRLPCPADGSLPTGNANQGLELAAGGACTVAALTNGVVPWRTLGLAQADALDAWNSVITYRVWGGAGVVRSLTVASGMDMTACDPAQVGLTAAGACNATTSPMNWLTADATVNARGFRICNASPCAVGSATELASKANGNGVAYVLISHGANRVGSYTPNGTLITTASGAGPGALEVINQNNTALRSVTPNDFYIDTDYNENAASYYDDLVLRPTVIQVAIDAGLGPRAP
jgi:type II secretory pathway pseudopilin PulG